MPSPGFKRILVPIDFSPGSGRALRHAATLARGGHARILPLHVSTPLCFTVDCGYGPVERVVPNDCAVSRTHSRLQRLLRRCAPAARMEKVMVCCGEAVEQIAKTAEQWPADLIVMLAHSLPAPASPGTSTPSGHTTDALVRRVRCPVLVLPGPTPRRDRPSTFQRDTL